MAQEKPFAGTCAELYQTVKKVEVTGIYLKEVDILFESLQNSAETEQV